MSRPSGKARRRFRAPMARVVGCLAFAVALSPLPAYAAPVPDDPYRHVLERLNSPERQAAIEDALQEDIQEQEREAAIRRLEEELAAKAEAVREAEKKLHTQEGRNADAVPDIRYGRTILYSGDSTGVAERPDDIRGGIPSPSEVPAIRRRLAALVGPLLPLLAAVPNKDAPPARELSAVFSFWPSSVRQDRAKVPPRLLARPAALVPDSLQRRALATIAVPFKTPEAPEPSLFEEAAAAAASSRNLTGPMPSLPPGFLGEQPRTYAKLASRVSATPQSGTLNTASAPRPQPSLFEAHAAAKTRTSATLHAQTNAADAEGDAISAARVSASLDAKSPHWLRTARTQDAGEAETPSEPQGFFAFIRRAFAAD